MGADKPEGFGDYFSWGNIEGHSLTSGYVFSQENYQNTEGASIATDIPLEKDAARIIKGDKWRIPTSTEFNELVENCNIIYTTLNGVFGFLLTSRINGQIIFIPAAGDYVNTEISNLRVGGYIWSSTFSTVNNCTKLALRSDSAPAIGNSPRYFGMSIRPVYDENPNRSVDPPTPEE